MALLSAAFALPFPHFHSLTLSLSLSLFLSLLSYCFVQFPIPFRSPPCRHSVSPCEEEGRRARESFPWKRLWSCSLFSCCWPTMSNLSLILLMDGFIEGLNDFLQVVVPSGVNSFFFFFFWQWRLLDCFYSSLNCPSQLSGWKPIGGDPCGDSWEGISCSDSAVISIDLAGLGLNGTLGYLLSNLLSLKTLDMSNNFIHETIPYQLPPNLSYLNLASNNLTGNLPYSLSTMVSLVYLNSSHNFLSQSVGDFFANLQNLSILDLSSNNLSGDLPNSLGLLSNLSSLYLQNNQFTGSVDLLSNLDLENLNIANNHFTGWIPQEFHLIPNLQIEGNNFENGPAPPPPPYAPPPPHASHNHHNRSKPPAVAPNVDNGQNRHTDSSANKKRAYHKAATNSFSPEFLIGEGFLGRVYKAEISNGKISTDMVPSFGYSAPEFVMSGIYTIKSDVYSFGVVMLELLTGRKALDSSRVRSEQSLVRWAMPQLHDIDALSKMVDPALKGIYPAKSLSRFADVIALCVQPEPEFRPPMSEVVQALVKLMQRTSLVRRGSTDEVGSHTGFQSMKPLLTCS
ncbi:hypothetical protein HPP92_010275 [Vanilla planifolia]|uniref:Protein kinase domain-containing protein n=1 Tax=Vanilla planifolia TaxID=51239 RepID=A0A835R3S5_VANPL|nr:hypothetical protein HPP92_010275 [Vanilla planifolia]